MGSGVWVELRATTTSGIELTIIELIKNDEAMIIFS